MSDIEADRHAHAQIADANKRMSNKMSYREFTERAIQINEKAATLVQLNKDMEDLIQEFFRRNR
jgi:hypothetical protein